MKKATFYVDHCFVAGGDVIDCHLSGRYRFDLSPTEEEYEELYEIRESHGEELNNRFSDWAGQEKWFDRINGAAIYAFQKTNK